MFFQEIYVCYYFRIKTCSNINNKKMLFNLNQSIEEHLQIVKGNYMSHYSTKGLFRNLP